MGRKLRRRQTSAFEFQPFSAQQLRLLSWWSEGSPLSGWDGVIADGSIRAGKTVAMIDSFITWSQAQHSYEDFIIAGRSVGALKRNVLKPLFQILRSKGIAWFHHRSENWVLIGTNVYYLFGGSTEASQDDLAGLTAAGALVEEAARLKESFVNECVNRCSVEGSKIWFNCNPGGPKHWFKKNFVDPAAEKKLVRLHFTLDDNPSLSETIKARYRRMFSGVWFKRYILGLWVAAEGVIFPMFKEEGEGAHVVETGRLMKREKLRGFERYIVAMDYGTASSAMTMGLYGLYRVAVEDPTTGRHVKQWALHLVKEYHWSGKEEGRQKTDPQYADDYEDWIGDVKPSAIYVDPSAASFIAEMQRRRHKVRPAANAVEDGNRFVAQLLSQGRLSVDPGCTHTIEEFYAYVWDAKAQDKGEDKPMKENDHHMDRNRYAAFSHLGQKKAALRTASAAL